MIVLHSSNEDKFKLVMIDGQFALPNYKLPSEENMEQFLEGHPRISEELKECIKKHKKGFIKFIKKILRKERNLMAIYEEIVHYSAHFGILSVSEELRGKLRNVAILVKFIKKPELGDIYIYIYDDILGPNLNFIAVISAVRVKNLIFI
jgi:hypothetical protein